MAKYLILITTCDHYFEENIPALLGGVESAKIPKNNILIVNAQASENKTRVYRGVKVVDVSYTLLQLTGLYHILKDETFDQSTIIVALPCTVRFGTQFMRKLMPHLLRLHKSHHGCMPIINFRVMPTMDMGFFKYNHLKNMSRYLEAKKLNTYTVDDLHKLKQRLIYDENKIFGLPSPLGYHRVFPQPEFGGKWARDLQPYEFESKPSPDVKAVINHRRKIVQQTYTIKESKGVYHILQQTYFKDLDLTKVQRNFRGPLEPLNLGIK